MNKWIDGKLVTMGVGFWTPERERELKDLWRKGASASQIARQLGTSRNAVIGKLYRVKAVRPPEVTPSKFRLPPIPKPATPPRPDLDELLPESRPAVLLELNRTHCRWPIGDPKKPGFHFCGAYRSPRTVNGRPTAYCEAHTRLSLSDTPPAPMSRVARFMEAAE